MLSSPSFKMIPHRLFLAAACSLATACAIAAPDSAAPAAPAVPAAAPVPKDAAVPAPALETAPAAKRASTKIRFSQCNVDGPYIAMTYDDGPHGANTPRLLDMLKQRSIKATFFVCGECVAQYPEIAKRIVDEGHEIANHSWSHPQLTRIGETNVVSQLQRTHDVVRQTTGVEMTLLRPPYGAFTTNQIGWAKRKWGYDTILWDVDPLDWKYRSASHVQSEILKHTVPGSIILTHDIHKTTIDAMPATLDGLAAKGFKFVTVSQLIAMDRPATPKPAPQPATARREPAAAAAKAE